MFDFIKELKQIKYIPKKFTSENSIDKNIANFIIIVKNYSNIKEIDYISYILDNIISIDNYKNFICVPIAAFIYLDYNIFLKFINIGMKIDIDYININKLIYKIVKYDISSSIYLKFKYIEDTLKIKLDIKMIKSIFYIFNYKTNILNINTYNKYYKSYLKKILYPYIYKNNKKYKNHKKYNQDHINKNKDHINKNKDHKNKNKDHTNKNKDNKNKDHRKYRHPKYNYKKYNHIKYTKTTKNIIDYNTKKYNKNIIFDLIY
jgi:hypothetical protein